LVYLGAPVLYVSIVQGALCDRLGASKTVSNLPSTVYFWLTPLPILVAWYFSAVRLLRPVLAATYLTIATGGAVVACILVLAQDDDLVILAVIAHAGMLGCALGVIATYEWEVIGKGVSPSRRGKALALAFGVGPAVAFLSSLGSQLLLA